MSFRDYVYYIRFANFSSNFEKYKEFIKKILINMSQGDEWDNLSKLDEINKKIKTENK